MDLWLIRDRIFSLWKFLLIGVLVGLAIVGGFATRGTVGELLKRQKSGAVSGSVDVIVPTIINGDLVLPKVITGDSLSNTSPSLSKARLGVVSANLIGVMDQQSQKLVSIRILGEMVNEGEMIIDGISPVVKFLDVDGKSLGQKIGQLSTGWNFFGVHPGEKTFYDVTVDNPPQAEKLEIVLNAPSATEAAIFDVLKIASRSMEVKTAQYQQSANSSQQLVGTESGDVSGQESVEYYSVTGSVVNILSDPVSDIAIYSWARDKEDKIFAFNRQDFKNDLLLVGDKIDFRIVLLPLKLDSVFDSYEVAAWGKRYRLNL